MPRLSRDISFCLPGIWWRVQTMPPRVLALIHGCSLCGLRGNISGYSLPALPTCLSPDSGVVRDGQDGLFA